MIALIICLAVAVALVGAACLFSLALHGASEEQPPPPQVEPGVGYYLGIRVEPVGPIEGGWVWARWPDGRQFRHWADQIKGLPWGTEPLL